MMKFNKFVNFINILYETKSIDIKAAQKMMMKLSKGVNSSTFYVQHFLQYLAPRNCKAEHN